MLRQINETVPLQGRAGLLGDHKNNTFCGVCCGKGEVEKSTFVITRSGLLVEFNERRHMDKWVELRVSESAPPGAASRVAPQCQQPGSYSSAAVHNITHRVLGNLVAAASYLSSCWWCRSFVCCSHMTDDVAVVERVRRLAGTPLT